MLPGAIHTLRHLLSCNKHVKHVLRYLLSSNLHILKNSMIKSQWKGGRSPSAFSKVDVMLRCNGRNPFSLAVTVVTRGPFLWHWPSLQEYAPLTLLQKVCRMLQSEKFLHQMTPLWERSVWAWRGMEESQERCMKMLFME